MKHIVLFSGGAASSYCAYLVLQKEKKEDVILLHTATYSEHKDSNRFRIDISRYLQKEITEVADGRNIWELIDDNHCLPSQFAPFCTRILKQEQSEKFYKTLSEDYILYFGYGKEEWRRVQKQTARFEHMGKKSKYPLFELKISNEEIKRIIKEDWGIKLPEPYKHLKHNNCIPCFKAGKYEWKNYYLYYPKEYEKAVQKEKEIGYTVFKDCTLEELREKFKHNKEFEDSQLSINDLPCMCAL
jgi:3'-phosphoadenosine 5'-phosphosulfate sulfotransferase (PAPS reductase)/FAD synthetase